MYICIDFDGTCTSYAFPEVGKSIGAEKVLKQLVAKGHKLILFTMRSNKRGNKSNDPEIQDIDGNFLDSAIEWFRKNNIKLYGIQTNPDQATWTESPKAYGHMYIDDAALGCPLKFDKNISDRPFADWEKIEEILKGMKVI
jgi:hypothetical protein